MDADTNQEASPAPVVPVIAMAEELFKEKVGWEQFYEEILGPEGAVRTQYPEVKDRLRFMHETSDGLEIMEMLFQLRSASGGAVTGLQDMVPIRMPKALHESLRIEGNEHNISMNKLCVMKLMEINGREV